MQEEVILTDANDQPVGVCEKMEAHEKGLLHRAFSVFIFNSDGKMLLQRRALEKYHSGGLWTNACCSHPRPGEDTLAAAKRRLQEELGFTCPIIPAFTFLYKADFENGLTEHEFDHVFTGTYDDLPKPAASEVMDYCYKSLAEIEEDIQADPQKFTAWFLIAIPKLAAYLKANGNISADSFI